VTRAQSTHRAATAGEEGVQEVWHTKVVAEGKKNAGRTYYRNKATKVSVWKEPTDGIILALA
jgi:predicted secreted protein